MIIADFMTCAGVLNYVTNSSSLMLESQEVFTSGKFSKNCSGAAIFWGSDLAVCEAAISKAVTCLTTTLLGGQIANYREKNLQVHLIIIRE